MKRLFAAVCMTVLLLAGTANASLVISQVYGGGGSASSPYYTNDYVQLFNSGSTDINLSGYSLEYAAATNTSTFGSSNAQVLSGTIKANSYFLVQESGTGSVGATHADPSFDLSGGSLALSNSAGKIALFNRGYSSGTSTTSGTIGVNGLVDFVGYGTTANFSLYPAMTQNLNLNTAAIRTTNASGNTVFVAGTPNPNPVTTPIPAAAWLFGSGLFGLVGAKRKMRA